MPPLIKSYTLGARIKAMPLNKRTSLSDYIIIGSPITTSVIIGS